jgi:hypothetical protein
MFTYMQTDGDICKPIINTAVVNAVNKSTHTHFATCSVCILNFYCKGRYINELIFEYTFQKEYTYQEAV